MPIMAKAWLLVEWLENRTAPANCGIPWQDPSHITLSLAPDGTVIAGHTSNLFAALAPQFPTPAAWQREVIHLNSSYTFNQDNLYPVMLHEAGHVFGFGASPDDPTMQPMPLA
jgi:hypothetical protein